MRRRRVGKIAIHGVAAWARRDSPSKTGVNALMHDFAHAGGLCLAPLPTLPRDADEVVE
jgi:hypothetical protein